MDAKIIEASHRHIVASVNSGIMDAAQGRMQVAALVVESGAAAKVAKEKSSGQTEQEIADITVVLQNIIVDKLLTTESYDFKKAASSSLMGWAMSYARNSKDNRLSNMRQRETSRVTPFSHHDAGIDSDQVFGSGIDAKTANSDHWSTQSIHSTNEDELFELAVELLNENKKGLRENGRLFVDCAILCMSYHLPMALRATNFADREYVRTVLMTDPTAAHWSLHDYYEIASLEITPKDSRFDSRLLALWENFDLAEADLLLSLPSKVAHAIALAAASPKPKPTSRNLDKFRTEIKRTSGSKGWKAIGSKLADSFIANEYEAFSEFHTRDLDKLAVRDHERAIEDFSDLLAAAANFPGHPLGVTPSAIYQSLTMTANAMLGDVYAIKGATT